MREDFLHFIWKNQCFDRFPLNTCCGDPVVVLKQGHHNFDSGPDFSNSRIKIGKIEWIGNIEIHYKSSDWYHHNHHDDKAYENVILHVVWSNDKPVKRRDDTFLPTIELKNKINPDIIFKYQNLIKHQSQVPCSGFLNALPQVHMVSMIEKAAIERIQNKARIILELLHDLKGDWDQAIYLTLAKNFGFKLNSPPFERLGSLITFKILNKNINSLFQMEALLFGAGGFLNSDFTDEYPRSLQKEHSFLSQKYMLQGNEIDQSEWKFSKLRPANFPTHRLAQFAALFKKSPLLLHSILQIENIANLIELCKIEISPYWQNHWVFDKPSSVGFKNIGLSSIRNIAINTVAPVLVAYSQAKDDSRYLEKAIALLETIKGEENSIITTMKSASFSIINGLQSQGAIELYNNYCLKKNCLNCAIGTSIIKK